MDKEKEVWIEDRVNAIVEIAEDRATELAPAMKDYIKLVSSSHENREQRQKALLKPMAFAREALIGLAGYIAEAEYDQGKDTYLDHELIERMNESILAVTQIIASREQFKSGQGRSN